jgi:hypothetical protein
MNLHNRLAYFTVAVLIRTNTSSPEGPPTGEGAVDAVPPRAAELLLPIEDAAEAELLLATGAALLLLEAPAPLAPFPAAVEEEAAGVGLAEEPETFAVITPKKSVHNTAHRMKTWLQGTERACTHYANAAYIDQAHSAQAVTYSASRHKHTLVSHSGGGAAQQGVGLLLLLQQLSGDNQCLGLRQADLVHDRGGQTALGVGLNRKITNTSASETPIRDRDNAQQRLTDQVTTQRYRI